MALPEKSEIEKILDDVDEIKKSIRPPKEEEEYLTEIEYCRKYSKTRSMGQD
tara:strand:- start:110 stop:265 length:156 start_codon:yes stop_codon:yes gene_type:complete